MRRPAALRPAAPCCALLRCALPGRDAARLPRALPASFLLPPLPPPCCPPQLGRALQELSGLGFSKDQVSAAILKCPAVTQYT